MNAYFSTKNSKASRALKRALEPGHRLLASLARLRSTTSATFSLGSWGPPWPNPGSAPGTGTFRYQFLNVFTVSLLLKSRICCSKWRSATRLWNQTTSYHQRHITTWQNDTVFVYRNGHYFTKRITYWRYRSQGCTPCVFLMYVGWGGGGGVKRLQRQAGRWARGRRFKSWQPTSAETCLWGRRLAAMLALYTSKGVAPKVNLKECISHTSPPSANKAEPTLVLKPREDVTRIPKHWYQWPRWDGWLFIVDKLHGRKTPLILRFLSSTPT